MSKLRRRSDLVETVAISTIGHFYALEPLDAPFHREI